MMYLNSKEMKTMNKIINLTETYDVFKFSSLIFLTHLIFI